jgi:REP element-mobilizing transposase RayT
LMKQTPEGCKEIVSWAQRFLVFTITSFFLRKSPFLSSADWRPRMHSYLGGVIRGMNGVAESVGGVEDHVHILASLRPVHRIADVLRDLKKESSRWVHEKFDSRFAW